MRLIGIDCAVDPKNVGFAVAEVVERHACVVHLERGTRLVRLEDRIVEWIADASGPVVLALDAPLGWPVALSAQLTTHVAGACLTAPPNAMFRRQTDDFVGAMAKRPLDVGADRIARCAHAALDLLERIRRLVGVEIPLAWDPRNLAPVSAIEVYPAATLVTRGHPATGYKDYADPAAALARALIVAGVGNELELSRGHRKLMRQVDHLLDAVLCVLAALDFVHGDSLPPPNPIAARREGWIWLRGGSD